MYFIRCDKWISGYLYFPNMPDEPWILLFYVVLCQVFSKSMVNVENVLIIWISTFYKIIGWLWIVIMKLVILYTWLNKCIHAKPWVRASYCHTCLLLQIYQCWNLSDVLIVTHAFYDNSKKTLSSMPKYNYIWPFRVKVLKYIAHTDITGRVSEVK